MAKVDHHDDHHGLAHVAPVKVLCATGGSLLLLTLVSAGALVVTLLVLVRSIRRAGIGSVLRMGEE